MRKEPLIIYHFPCLDGFTAAWAAWLKYPDAEFVPGVYGQEPPDCAGRDVYLLDFSYKREVMKKILLSAKHTIILDHHKSAEADLRGLDHYPSAYTCDVVFDMKKSGARLAWEWFHPDETVPLLVRMVEDRDLWRFALPDSKEINAALFSYDYDFETWSRLRTACEDQDRYLPLLAGGAAIERKQSKDVKELVAKLCRQIQLRRCWSQHPYSVPCANLPYTLASDAANLMAKDAPFAATYFQEANGTLNFSLRSVEGGADVSEVAVLYGGGGHKHAAGFRVASMEEL